mmetsp:Transcript_28087/g.71599  ORF Transcript_28087/g.71599 Transcript_28087/m.71599 type:complete len:294 (+) Transcript_28087:556-1437(+)
MHAQPSSGTPVNTALARSTYPPPPRPFKTQNTGCVVGWSARDGGCSPAGRPPAQLVAAQRQPARLQLGPRLLHLAQDGAAQVRHHVLGQGGQRLLQPLYVLGARQRRAHRGAHAHAHGLGVVRPKRLLHVPRQPPAQRLHHLLLHAQPRVLVQDHDLLRGRHLARLRRVRLRRARLQPHLRQLPLQLGDGGRLRRYLPRQHTVRALQLHRARLDRLERRQLRGQRLHRGRQPLLLRLLALAVLGLSHAVLSHLLAVARALLPAARGAVPVGARVARPAATAGGSLRAPAPAPR